MSAIPKYTGSFFELFEDAGFHSGFANRDHALLFLMQAKEAVEAFARGGFTDPALDNMATLMGLQE